MGKRLLTPACAIRGVTFPKPEGHFSSSFIFFLAFPVLSATIFNGTPMHRKSSRLTFTSTSHHTTQPSRERLVGLKQSPAEPVAASHSTGRRRLFQASPPASGVSTYTEHGDTPGSAWMAKGQTLFPPIAHGWEKQIYLTCLGTNQREL